MTPDTTPLTESRSTFLTEILHGEGELGAGERVEGITQLEGGWSRYSHVARVESSKGERRQYVVRVKAPVALFDTDLRAEFETLAALQELDIPTPRVFGLHDSEDNPFGGQLFVMDHLNGTSYNVWRAKDNAALKADWEAARGIATDALRYLAAIHSVSHVHAPEVLPVVAFEDQVLRWRGEYEGADLLRDPVMEEAFAWLLSRPPEPVPATLVHGDYRVGNLLVSDARVTGILDWELAYVGDPRFDLGYMVQPYMAGKHLLPKTELAGAIADKAWVFEEYERLTGNDLDREAVRSYSVLGALSLMSMTYTGARRFADGATSDVRRAWARYMQPGLREDLTRLMQW